MAEKKEPESGIEAITVPTPKPPYAMPKMVRGEDGMMHTVYVDPNTNQPIGNLAGYTILDGNNYYQVTGAADKNKDGEVDPKETQKATDAALDRNGHTTALDADKSGSFKGSTNPMNNYGYQHKPAAVKYAGLIPGPIGMAAKAVNVGWNANNLSATNTARQMLGLSPVGVKDTVKGLAKDNKGQVSNSANINGQNYSVGFEAMSPDDRTNLTPSEARQRSLTLGGISEDTTKQKEADTGKSRVEKATGISKGWATRALDHVFGVTPDTPTGVSTPEGVAEKAKSITPGAGFANLGGDYGKTATAGTGPNGIGYSHPDRGAWNTGMTQDTADTAARLSGAIGGMQMNSGYRSPAVNAAVGGTKGSFHQKGMAFDIDTSNMTDDQKQKAVEMGRLAGATGIGAYSTPNARNSIHFDLGARPAPTLPGAIQTVDNTYGMMDKTALNAATRAPGWFTKGMTEDRFAPTPTARPAPPEVDRNYTGQGVTPSSLDPVGNSLSPTANRSVFDSIGPKDSVAKQTVANAVQSNSGVASAKLGTSPAAMAAMGLSARTAQEKATMARAIAGELSPSTLSGLAKNDPVARAEFGSMVATMENRAASAFGKKMGVSNPTQYNSMMASNLATTNQNYGKYSAALKQAMDDYYSGKIQNVNYSATSYFNPDVTNPAWGANMTDPSKIGQHLFGSLPEYGPDAAARTAANAMSTMAGTDYSPGKMKDDMGYSGYSGVSSGMTGTSNHLGKSADDSRGGYTGSYGYGGNSGMTGTDAHAGKTADDSGGGYSRSGSSYGGGNSSTGGGSGYGGGSAGNGTASGGSAGMSGGGGYSPGGMGSPSGSSSGSASTGGGGLGRNSDGSSNGWGGRSGSV